MLASVRDKWPLRHVCLCTLKCLLPGFQRRHFVTHLAGQKERRLSFPCNTVEQWKGSRIYSHSHAKTCMGRSSRSGQPGAGLTQRRTGVLSAFIQSQVWEERGIRLCLLDIPSACSKLPCLLGTSTQADAVLSALGNPRGLWVFRAKATHVHAHTRPH